MRPRCSRLLNAPSRSPRTLRRLGRREPLDVAQHDRAPVLPAPRAQERLLRRFFGVRFRVAEAQHDRIQPIGVMTNQHLVCRPVARPRAQHERLFLSASEAPGSPLAPPLLGFRLRPPKRHDLVVAVGGGAQPCTTHCLPRRPRAPRRPRHTRSRDLLHSALRPRAPRVVPALRRSVAVRGGRRRPGG